MITSIVRITACSGHAETMWAWNNIEIKKFGDICIRAFVIYLWMIQYYIVFLINVSALQKSEPGRSVTLLSPL